VPTGPVVWQHGFERVLHTWLRLPFPLWNGVAGASIPSFVAAVLLCLIIGRKQTLSR
jgi:hypothetical protein